MNRRELLKKSAALGLAAAAPAVMAGEGVAGRGGPAGIGGVDQSKSASAVSPLRPPEGGTIPVAYVLSPGAVEVDFTGPWGIFGSVMLPGKDMVMPFHQYTVAENKAPLHTDSGLTIVPDYTFETAPQPKLIVIPAQNSAPGMVQWIRKASAGTDVTMSVCTGAFVLAKTGLLDGKSATTHHSAYKHFADQFPKVRLMRGARFVDEGNIATAGGLTCGSDLAMHIVERYFGRKLAEDTAYYLEYQSLGWKDPNSNAIYARPAKS